MKKWFRNEHGLTLAELIATLVISSFIIIFIMSVFVLVQRQYTAQSTNTKELTDVSIAMLKITKDIRYADDVEAKDNKLTLYLDDSEKQSPITYSRIGDVLTRNGGDYIYNIEDFNIEENGRKIHILIQSQSGKNVETDIVKR